MAYNRRIMPKAIPIDRERIHSRENAPEDTIPGKWCVDGYMAYDPAAGRARVVITEFPRARAEILNWASAHELGHVRTYQDMIDNGADVAPVEVWDGEVLAWLDALNGNLHIESGEFVLDCLYSYASTLGITYDVWLETKYMIADHGIDESTREYLRDYVPLEPSQEFDPAKGCGNGGSFGKGKADDNGPDHVPPNNDAGKGKVNDDWSVLSTPEVIEDVKRRGFDALKDRGVKFNDVRNLPPVLKAILGKHAHESRGE